MIGTGAPALGGSGGEGWVSPQCAVARRPGGVVEAHALCREADRCACRCHHKYAASLGVLIGGPCDVRDAPETVTGDLDPEPWPVPAPAAPARWPSQRRDRRRTPPVTPVEAAAELREAGFEPIETYPGRASVGWSCRCLTCGAARRLKLSDVRAGRRCLHVRNVPPS
ncbi:hypothetical protein RKE29_09170 [Streptomyces sp. B1866]|uniref:hypothetical protein n=1 Tax=Streptomyces sp. B1866 TaxID=3075431 RepID=UPI00288F6A6E|nr:hypothetical protein [Streptomyces sp. B1866]MDT3396810.1 hypothetical protein [Streptomyces sp. B1866]